MATDPAGRRDRLVELYRELQDCRKCPLAEGRTTVVFGTGNADADLMFAGEAPGFHEDQQGKPFGGRQVFLYPIFHPAAALRTPSVLDQLRADFQSLPALLAEALPSFGAEEEPEPELVGAGVEPDQLDLF